MNYSIEKALVWIKKKISVEEKYAFFTAILVGFFSHGFIFFNKISYLDDNTFYFGVGATYPSGRWALGLIEDIQQRLHTQIYSVPVINGMLSVVLIAFTAMLLVHVLKIKNTFIAGLLGTYMVVFPVVTSTFSFMFTAPYYFFACFLMVAAVWMTNKAKYGIIPAAILIAFGMGIYQAYVGMATAVFVIMLIVDCKEGDFQKNFVNAIWNFVTLVFGVVLYFVFNKVFLDIKGMSLGSYQGIGGITNGENLSLEALLGGIKNAYLFWPNMMQNDNMGLTNSQWIQGLYGVCLVLLVVIAVLYLYRMWKRRDVLNMLYIGVLFAMSPLAIGIIYVMTIFPGSILHTVMVYSFVMIPIYPLVLLDNIDIDVFKEWTRVGICWLRNISVLAILMMSVYYFCLDNVAYLKANYQQENAIAYYTIMVGKIKSIENYSDELPVIFLGNVDGQDWAIANRNEFDQIKIKGYSTRMNEFISYYARPKFWELHCGYTYMSPEDTSFVYESETIWNMPCYPEDGSIQIVNGVVVVKFSDYY